MSLRYGPLEVLSMVSFKELENLNASLFEKLPAELRTMIYKLVLVDPERRIKVRSIDPEKEGRQAQGNSTALMSVNKQINSECKPIFWSMSHFIVGNGHGKALSFSEANLNGLGSFMTIVPIDCISLITKVTFEMNLNYSLDESLPDIAILGDAFPTTSYDVQAIEYTTDVLLLSFTSLKQLTLKCRFREKHERIYKMAPLNGSSLSRDEKIDLIYDSFDRLMAHPSVLELAIGVLYHPDKARENLAPLLSDWPLWNCAVEGDKLVMRKKAENLLA